MATIQTMKTIFGKMNQNYPDAVLKLHFSYVCLFNFPSKQNISIFGGDLIEFRGRFILGQNYAN